MKTDWALVREMMNAAIDACERIERAGYTPQDRAGTIDVQGGKVSVHDLLVSAWTLPETVRYKIIRDRHGGDDDLAYVPEAARILTAMAGASAELVGAAASQPAHDDIRGMISWFRDHAAPAIERAIAQRHQDPHQESG